MAKKEKMEALVPVEEQPYPVPENWRWVRQGSISVFINGRAYKQDELLEDDTLTPVLRVGNLFTNGSWYYSDLQLESNKYIDNDDLIYAWSASFGPYIWNGGKVIYHYHIWKIMLSEFLQKTYYYYWLLEDTERLKSIGHGTGMLHITKDMMEKAPMPLPPISEQRRIVARIECLFAKLDEAKERARAVVDGFEDRKAAILHKAFAGELTEAWRKQHDECFREIVTIKSICSSLSYGTASKSSKEGAVAVIRMGNLQGGEIDWNNLVFSNNVVDNQKYRLTDGDVLFNRTNSAEQVGKTSIYRGERPAIYAGYLIKLDYDRSVIIGDYLNYLLNSPEARDYCNRVKSDAVNQSNINAQKIGAFEIPLISIEEQRELVRLVSEQIKAAQIVKESALNSISAIDSMKNSILAKAFRGELGTNDPTELPVDIM